MDTDKSVEILKEPIEKLTIPLASQVGQTLSDAWELVFGGFSTFVEKKRLIRQKNVESFKQSLSRNIQSIPPECLQEPSFSIIGPALEASKFYFEEEEVRELFSKLISNSMDNRYNDKIHVSYVEIIKQMTPLDAQNLTLFQKAPRLPLASFRMRTTSNSYSTLLPVVFLSNPKESNVEKQAISISSLEHLGLLSSSFLECLNPFPYDTFTNSERYLFFKEEVGESLYCKEGIVSLTPLGASFINVCFPPLPQLIVG